MFAATRILELDLRAWTGNCPSGAVLYSDDGNGRTVIDSEYCDSIREFKDFIDRNASCLEKDGTEIAAIFDPADAAASNVIAVIEAIACYLDDVLEGIR